MFWFSYQGEKIPIGFVEPDQTFGQRTFATHPFAAEIAGVPEVHVMIEYRDIFIPVKEDDKRTFAIEIGEPEENMMDGYKAVTFSEHMTVHMGWRNNAS